MQNRYLQHISRICTIFYFLLLLSGCSGGDLLDVEGVDWQLEKVASGRMLGLHSSLGVTSDGTVHIAYYDPIRYRLYYTNRSAPSVWNKVRLDTLSWVGNGITLCIDADDHVHLLYQDCIVNSIRHAWFDSTGWATDYIGPATSNGDFLELVVETGEIHMVELSMEPETDMSGLDYWINSGATWNHIANKSLTGKGNNIRSCFGLAFIDNIPNIVTIRLTEPPGNRSSGLLDGFEIRVSRFQGFWVDSVYVSEVAGGYNRDQIRQRSPEAVALIYDNNSIMHLIYRAPDGTLLDLAGETVDTGVTNGFLRCRKGPGGELWLLYQAGDSLVLAHRPDGGHWNRVGAISHADPDGRWDLYVDSEHTPHISFYSRNGEDLWYGRWDGTP